MDCRDSYYYDYYWANLVYVYTWVVPGSTITETVFNCNGITSLNGYY